MSDPVRSHRLQPTRLPHPWDSPGKNTGVGCHFLLQCMKVKSESEVAQSCPTLWTPWTAAHQATPCILAWDFPGKSTGVGCHFLLQCMKVKSESEVTQSCPALATPWTAAHQATPSMGFSRQKYWNGVPLPSPVVYGRSLQNSKFKIHTLLLIREFILLRNHINIMSVATS